MVVPRRSAREAARRAEAEAVNRSARVERGRRVQPNAKPRGFDCCGKYLYLLSTNYEIHTMEEQEARKSKMGAKLPKGQQGKTCFRRETVITFFRPDLASGGARRASTALYAHAALTRRVTALVFESTGR